MNHKKATLGALTFAPFITGFWCIYEWIRFAKNSFMTMDGPNKIMRPSQEMLESAFQSLGPFIITLILSLGLLIFYLIDIAKYNPNFKKVNDNSKLIWVFIVLVTGSIGMLIYYFVEYLPRPENGRIKIIS